MRGRQHHAVTLIEQAGARATGQHLHLISAVKRALILDMAASTATSAMALALQHLRARVTTIIARRRHRLRLRLLQ